MRYVLAVVLPPFALLACRKYVQFTINLIIWLISIPLILFMGVGLIGWLMCTMHAVIVCMSHGADKRFERLATAIESRAKSPASATVEVQA
jgi:hypothetical protein